jgi:hypothetical protein
VDGKADLIDRKKNSDQSYRSKSFFFLVNNSEAHLGLSKYNLYGMSITIIHVAEHCIKGFTYANYNLHFTRILSETKEDQTRLIRHFYQKDWKVPSFGLTLLIGLKQLSLGFTKKDEKKLQV